MGGKDRASGTLLPDSTEETKGSLVWANDGRTLFYVTLDEEHRPSKVFRHRLGDDAAADVLVYEEADPGFFVDLGKTESDRYIVISAHDHTTRSEEHTSELQSLMRISYAVFCFKKKTKQYPTTVRPHS